MKKQILKKLLGYVILFVILVTSCIITQSVKAQDAEGGPRPGYICRCSIVGYGCAGSSACLRRCQSACHQSVIKNGKFTILPLTELPSNSIAHTASISIVQKQLTTKISLLEWKRIEPLNVDITEENMRE